MLEHFWFDIPRFWRKEIEFLLKNEIFVKKWKFLLIKWKILLIKWKFLLIKWKLKKWELFSWKVPSRSKNYSLFHRLEPFLMFLPCLKLCNMLSRILWKQRYIISTEYISLSIVFHFTISTYIKGLVKRDRVTQLHCFEKLYHCVLYIENHQRNFD